MSKDYEENVESLVTFGEDGHTLRKDDPSTKKVIEKMKTERASIRKEMIANDEASVFEGINLYNKREESETYENYKERIKLNNYLKKLYSTLGREECKLQFPQGFAYAVDQALITMDKQKNEEESGFKDKDGNPLKVVVTD